MVFTEYNDPSSFLSILEKDFSSSFENELMIGLVSAILTNPNTYNTTPILATIYQHQHNPFFLFWTPPWPLILYGEEKITIKTLDVIINYIEEKNIPLSGVNAKNDLSKMFAQQWINKRNCLSQEKMNMTVYALQEIQAISPCKGKIIEANHNHFDLLFKWSQLFHNDIKLQYEGEEYLRSYVHHMIETRNAFLWTDPEPVCMTFRERPHDTGFSIGYVYTLPDKRKKGYATNLVHQICEQSFQKGYHYSVLFADKQNPISNHIYRNIGFKEVCEYQLIEFIY